MVWFRLMLLFPLFVCLPACGESSSQERQKEKVETLVPRGDEVSGWSIDSSRGGMKVGYSLAQITGIINGAQHRFEELGCDGYAQQYYVKQGADCTIEMKLALWDLKTKEGAKQILDETFQEQGQHYNLEIVSGVNDRCYLGSSGGDLISHTSTNNYYFRLDVAPSSNCQPDAVRVDTIAWLEQITKSL